MTATVILIVGIAGIFAAIMLSLTAVGVFDNEARGVGKSLSVLDAYSAAPPELRKELDPSFNDRVLTPLLDRTVNIGKKLTPADHADRIRHRLEVAGNPPGWNVDRVTSLKFIGFAGALVVSLIFAMLFGLGFAPMLAICVIAAIVGYLGAQHVPVPEGLRPDAEDAEGDARRARPADDLRGVRPRFRRRALPGRPQHRRTARRRVRSRAPGDADRLGPRRCAARPR